MKQNAQKGIWLFGPQTLDLVWVGAAPAPVPTVAERIRFALAHIRSNGYGPAFIPPIRRLAKAIAFCLKPSQVSVSGNEYVTTGLSEPADLETAWLSFSPTLWHRPQTGHGNADSLAARSSN